MPPLSSIPTMILGLLVTWGILGTWLLILSRLVAKLPLLPRANPVRVPWGAGSVLGMTFLHLGLQYAAVLIYLIFLSNAAPEPHRGKPEPPRVELMALMVSINFAMVFLTPLLLRLTSGAKPADMGLTMREGGRNAVRGILACCALLPIVYFVAFLANLVWEREPHPIEDMIGASPTIGIALVSYLASTVAAPVAEELLFRGVLLGWLWRFRERPDPSDQVLLLDSESGPPKRGFLPPTVANVLVSLLFAGVHYQQWPAPVPLFVLSLGLGYVYQRTGSLVAPIALHAAFNALSTTVMFVMTIAGQAPPAQ